MNKQIQTDYFQELSSRFQISGTMLDIGCGNLKYLFQFDTSKFKRLIGLDLKLPEDPFECYLDNTCPNLTSIDYDNLEKKFWSRYKFYKKDILDFQIDKDYYGFIFCKHVLHFIPHNFQSQLIDNLYSGLKYKGFLYLKINHNKNKQYTDHDKVDILTKDCFKEKKKGLIHYLYDPQELVQSLTLRYNPELITTDEKSVTVIIRNKNNC
jgi:hypothetical protein